MLGNFCQLPKALFHAAKPTFCLNRWQSNGYTKCQQVSPAFSVLDSNCSLKKNILQKCSTGFARKISGSPNCKWVSEGYKVSLASLVSQRPKATTITPPLVEFTNHQGDLAVSMPSIMFALQALQVCKGYSSCSNENPSLSFVIVVFLCSYHGLCFGFSSCTAKNVKKNMSIYVYWRWWCLLLVGSWKILRSMGKPADSHGTTWRKK